MYACTRCVLLSSAGSGQDPGHSKHYHKRIAGRPSKGWQAGRQVRSRQVSSQVSECSDPAWQGRYGWLNGWARVSVLDNWTLFPPAHGGDVGSRWIALPEF
jgi:hypothetical protein